MASYKMNELDSNPANAWELLKVFVPLLMVFSLIWRYIDKFFADKKAERIALISEVAKKAAEETIKEVVREIIRPINDRLTLMDKKIDDTSTEIHRRIDQYLKKNT